MAVNGWMRCKIGDIFMLTPGYAFKSGDFLSDGTPVIKIKNVKAGEIVLDDLSFVDTSFVETKSSYLIRRGDILISLSGNRLDGSKDTWVGKVAQFRQDGPYLLNQRVGILRPKDAKLVDTRCCSYLLSAEEYQQLFIAIATSSGGQANLSSSQILNAEVSLPPFDTQKAIACILGALDDKIELNRRMNRTLESIARAIFKSWFVDFDPVRAKAAGHSPPGLAPQLAALFPDAFEDSELGEIPKGWRVQSIRDVTVRVTKGDTPTKAALAAVPANDGRVPMLRVNAITEDGELIQDKLESIPEAIHFGKSRRSILNANDILYTNAGTIGRVALVQPEWLPANTNQAIAIIRPDPKRVPPVFLFMRLRQACFQSELHRDIVHAVQANLALGKISAAKLVMPPGDTINCLISPIAKMIERILTSRRECLTLAALRDALLPKLISGELRVPDAERSVGRAL